MLGLCLAFLLGFMASTTFSLFLYHSPLKVGDKLHLSLSKFDEDLLKDGKLCNSRVSQVKDLAEKAYGDTGVTVQILEKF